MMEPGIGGRHRVASVWRTFVACLLVSGTAFAADARPKSVEGLVPDGAAGAVLLDRPGKQLEAFLDGRLGARWGAFPPVKRWMENDLPAARFVAGQIASKVGLSGTELEEQLGGGRWALVGWPPAKAKGEAEDPAWMVVLQAADAAVLERGLAGLRKAAADGGEFVQGGERTYRARPYHHGEFKSKEKKTELFLCQLERFAVLSNREDRLKQSIDLWAGRRSASLERELRALPTPSRGRPAAVSAWVSPPRLRGVFETWRLEAIEKDPKSRIVLDPLAGLWESSKAIELRLELGESLRFDAAAYALPDKTPAWLEHDRLWGAATMPQRIPREAAVVVFGRADLSLLAEWVQAVGDDEARRVLPQVLQAAQAFTPEADLQRDLLPSLAQDWAFYLRVGDGEPKADEAPWEVVGLVGWGASPAGSAPVAEVMQSAIQSIGSSLVFAYNVQRSPEGANLVWRRRTDDQGARFTLASDRFPAGVEPTILVTAEGMRIASAGTSGTLAFTGSFSASLAGLAPWKSKPASEPGAPSTGSDVPAAQAAEAPIAFGAVVQTDRLLAALNRHEERLKKWLVEDRKASEAWADRGRKRLAEILTLSDVGWAVLGANSERIWFSLGVQVRDDASAPAANKGPSP